jgi:gluconolactonase
VSKGPSRWESPAPIRYPDPDVIVLDPRFRALVVPMAAIERIATGFRFTEGPAYYGDGRYLLFSDIPNDALVRWDEITGAVATLRNPAGYPDGNTRDRQGRLISCELGSRTLTRTEHDGTVTVLAASFEGTRLTGLVQRQRRRHPWPLSGRQGAEGDAVSRLPPRPRGGRVHHRHR